MRLWHKDLIPYLPRQQLLGQWRELNSIYKLKNRHILINFVYDEYDKSHLFWYSVLITSEMEARKYNLNNDNFKDYFKDYVYSCNENNAYITYRELYEGKMTSRYLKQCLYNLQEKHDCGGITDEEWKVISDNFDID